MIGNEGSEFFAETATKLAAVVAYTMEHAETDDDRHIANKILLSFRMPLSIYGAILLKDDTASSSASLLDLQTLRVSMESIFTHFGEIFTSEFRADIQAAISTVEQLIDEARGLPVPSEEPVTQ